MELLYRRRDRHEQGPTRSACGRLPRLQRECSVVRHGPLPRAANGGTLGVVDHVGGDTDVVESLDLGPQPKPGTQRRAVTAIAAVLVVLVAALIVYNNNRSEPSTIPEPTSVPTSRSLPTRAATPTPVPSPQQQWRIRGFLEHTDLDLFARSDGRLYRIQTGKQLVTAVDTPGLQSSGALIFIVDRDQVIVRGWGSPADGFRVTDGKEPEDLPDALKTPDNILPGPPGRLWVTTYRGDDPVTRLTDLQGRPVRADHGPSSYRADNVQTDGDQGLILAAAGGYYDMTPDGPRRLTRGQVLAVAPAKILTAECDSTLRCSRFLVDRDSGKRRRIGHAPINNNTYGNGTISDDGRFAALWRWTRTGPAELSILNLHTGATVARLDNHTGAGDASSLVWLPNHRLLGILNERLFIYDPTTGEMAQPDLHIDSLQQLGLRTPR